MDASLDLISGDDTLEVLIAPPHAEVVRAKKRRPLSPTCPYTSLSEIPRPFARLKKFIPLAISISVHVIVMLCLLTTFERAVQRSRIENVIEGAVNVTAPVVPVSATIAVVKETNPLEAMAKTAPVEVEAPPPRDPVDADKSLLDRENIAEVSPPIVKLPDEPIVLGAAVQRVALATPAHAKRRASTSFAAAKAVSEKSPEKAAAEFFGVSGNARSVVYLCDASGSMLGTDQTIATQLQHAVLSLAPTQEFNVVFFGGNAPTTFSPSKLLSADPVNKVSACNFAKQFACRGNTNAVPAIQKALAFKPDILYLVTDGVLEDADEKQMLATVRSANHDRATQINIILISGAPQPDADGLRFLTGVAKETGGTCRVVNPNAM